MNYIRSDEFHQGNVEAERKKTDAFNMESIGLYLWSSTVWER